MSTELSGDITQHAEYRVPVEQHEYDGNLLAAVKSKADSFLRNPAAKSIDLSKNDYFFRPQRFKHEHPFNTLINLKGEASNTSFLIEDNPSIHDPKDHFTVIRWLTLGEDKGELPGGWIRISYREGKEPVLTAGLGESVPKAADSFWQYKGGKHCFQDNETDRKLSQQQIQQILSRIDAAQIDPRQTELTANEEEYHVAESSYALAVHDYADTLENGNWIERFMALMEFRVEEKKWDEFKKGFKRMLGLSVQTPEGLQKLRDELIKHKKVPPGRLGPPKVA